MKERQKHLFMSTGLITLGIAGTIIGHNRGYIKGTNDAVNPEAPRMVSFNDMEITYSDRAASGMKAYAIRPNSRGLLELQENKIDDDSKTFAIPISLGIDDRFGIVVIDRDVNLSETKYFSIEDDKVKEKK